MTDARGLYQKYVVERMDETDVSGGKHDNCKLFVLDLTHDREARTVAWIYARRVAKTRPALSQELGWLLHELDQRMRLT